MKKGTYLSMTRRILGIAELWMEKLEGFRTKTVCDINLLFFANLISSLRTRRHQQSTEGASFPG